MGNISTAAALGVGFSFVRSLSAVHATTLAHGDLGVPSHAAIVEAETKPNFLFLKKS